MHAADNITEAPDRLKPKLGEHNGDTLVQNCNPSTEVAEGRSFHPDEFAIALEQVVAGIAPEDYTDPAKFFSRTSFTRALSENVGLVLRRLSGQTPNTAPVLTLLTQFGGGKTHTLTTLYHLARNGDDARSYPGIAKLLAECCCRRFPRPSLACLSAMPGTRRPAPRRRGLTWRASWPATRGWRCWGRRPPPRRPAPRLCCASLRRLTRRCCCSSMRCSTSSTATAAWPTPSMPSSRT